MEDLEQRYLETEPFVLKRWAQDIFLKPNIEHVYDFRDPAAKEQLLLPACYGWDLFS
ncbi:MAG: hypothetical protein ACM3PA_01650 [Methanomassiliicoccales archaeon]